MFAASITIIFSIIITHIKSAAAFQTVMI